MSPGNGIRTIRLSVKLLLLVVLSVSLTAGAGAGAAIFVGRRVLTTEELKGRVEDVTVYAHAISFYVDSARSMLETTANLPQMRDFAQSHLVAPPRSGVPADAEASMRNLAALVLDHSKAFHYLMLLRTDGSVTFVEPRALEAAQSHGDLSFQPWYADVIRAGRSAVSDLQISTVTQLPVIVIATPVRSTDGRLLAIWAGGLRLEELSRIGSAGSLGAPPGGYGYVTDRRGLIIAHQKAAHYVQNQTDFSAVPVVRAALAGGRGAMQFVNPIEEEEKLGAFLSLPDLGWAVVHVKPTRVAFAPVSVLTRGILVSSAGLVLVMGLASVVLAQRIVGPIARLTAAVRSLGAGDFSERIEVRTGDEIEQLAEEFNRMAETLSESRSRISAYAGELERLVQGRTDTLRRLQDAHRELEAFSYSVSHDLRAPLRAMDGFSRIVVEQHAAGLSPEAQRYLRLVRENAQQMARLIDDLLAFSRAGRQPVRTEPVALAAVARQAYEQLRPEWTDRRVDLVIEDLPTVEADPAMLRQVFVNLLSNALKFTRGRAAARIEVGCQSERGQAVCFVTDNGVGFDMRYVDKLFGVFQRLHRAEEYEGTGVGLALVQRIIARHGGRVWGRGAVGQGATFSFTLSGGGEQ
jgi:signal transduction histidine kinase